MTDLPNYVDLPSGVSWVDMNMFDAVILGDLRPDGWRYELMKSWDYGKSVA